MMKSWRCDPYLWIHLAGLATVPLWIDLCLLGLAVGTPTLPGLELGLIFALGVLPTLVMQLRRPFYIFSLPGLALRPTVLKDNQLRLLTQFRRWRVRLGALLVPVPLVWLLVQLYPLAFLAREITPFGEWSRLGGVAIASLGFFLANLFLQVPVAVLQVMATSDRQMLAVVPYPADRAAADFTWLGLSVGKILPDIVLLQSDASTLPATDHVVTDLADHATEDVVSADPAVLHPELADHESAMGPELRGDRSETPGLADGHAEGSIQPHPEMEDLSELVPTKHLSGVSPQPPTGPRSRL